MHILYVENHRRFAQLVTSQYLSEHRVTVVPSLAAAQAHLERAVVEGMSYEVVLLDLTERVMPCCLFWLS